MSVISGRLTTGRRVALLAIFLTSIYLPVIAGFFGESHAVSLVENRVLAKMPTLELNWDSFNKFPDRFEKYFSDNFEGRSALIRNYNYLHFAIGVSTTKNVIIGKNGWLFLGGEHEIRSYRKTHLFNDAQMAQWRLNMWLIKRWLEDRGIKLVLLIAPNKSSIYPEYMPDNINVADKFGYFEQISSAAHDVGIEFIDPRKDLFERKKREEVYYRTDSHWNYIGGYVGYNLLMKSLGKWFPDLSPLQESSLKLTTIDAPVGDLVAMLGFPANYGIAYKTKTPMLNMDNNKAVRGDGRNSGPRVLVFHDSFLNLIPYLRIHFSHIATVLDHGFSRDVVDKEKPDVVIYEIVERSLMNGPGLLRGKSNEFLQTLYGITPAFKLPYHFGGNILDDTVPEGSVRYAEYGSTPSGVIMFGPYTKLKRGEYRAVFRMKSNGMAESPIVMIKVTANKGRKTLGSKTLKGADFNPGDWANFSIDINAVPDDEENVEFVADYLGEADVYIESAWFEKIGEKPLDIYDGLKGYLQKTQNQRILASDE